MMTKRTIPDYGNQGMMIAAYGGPGMFEPPQTVPTETLPHTPPAQPVPLREWDPQTHAIRVPQKRARVAFRRMPGDKIMLRVDCDGRKVEVEFNQESGFIEVDL